MRIRQIADVKIICFSNIRDLRNTYSIKHASDGKQLSSIYLVQLLAASIVLMLKLKLTGA